MENRFTGWTDVDLTDRGIDEAKSAGKLLYKESFKFDIVYTSVLKRSIHTMKLCLDAMKIKNISINYDWRLNERHYGALQGLNKSETAKKYGEKQVLLWRRSYNVPPPLLESGDDRCPKFDKKYCELKPNEIPRGESLKDTVNRIMPFWQKTILPSIFSGQNILIVAHGNSLRAIIKIIDRISDKNIIKLNIPTGIPLIYELNKKIISTKNYYLGDSNVVQDRLANVISQGKSN